MHTKNKISEVSATNIYFLSGLSQVFHLLVMTVPAESLLYKKLASKETLQTKQTIHFCTNVVIKKNKINKFAQNYFFNCSLEFQVMKFQKIALVPQIMWVLREFGVFFLKLFNLQVENLVHEKMYGKVYGTNQWTTVSGIELSCKSLSFT